MLFGRRPKPPTTTPLAQQASTQPSGGGQSAAWGPPDQAGLWPRPSGGWAWRDDPPPGAGGGRGPWLWPSGAPDSPWERYDPLRHRGLLAEFLRLGQRTQAPEVLSFANRWGTVAAPAGAAHGGSLADWQREAWTFRTLYEEWDALAGLARAQARDPVRRIRQLMVLRERYTWAPDGRSVLYRVALGPAEAPATGSSGTVTFELSPDTIGEAAFARLTPGDVAGAARHLVQHRVNERLVGRTTLVLDPGRATHLRMAADSLLTALYLMFALEMGQRSQTVGRCGNPRCPNGGQFFKTRRDQRFCDKRCRELAAYYRRRAAARAATSGTAASPG